MSSERIMNLLVTIPAESRRMNVGKDVIRILGSPAYICILQRKDRQSIAITPCAAEHPMSFKVPDRLLTDGQCRMRINGVQFVQALLEANGLATGKDYQFKGSYEAEKNAAVWSLSRSESAGLFPKQLVFVNGRGVLSPGENARPGDIVSVRGRGRFRLEGVSGETRKGRLRVTVARY